MAREVSRRNFIAGSTASVGMSALPFAALTTGYARYHGLHLASTDAARRAILEEMVAANRPLNLNVTGTYEIDRAVQLATYSGDMIELHPNCRLVSRGANNSAPVFSCVGSKGIRIRGGQFASLGPAAALLQRFALYFNGASDCSVEDVVIANSAYGGICFRNTTRCGYRNPVVRESLVYASPPANHGEVGYDVLVTGGASDFAGIGGLSQEGAGFGFAIQSLGHDANEVYNRVSLTGWRAIRALMYGAMIYRSTTTVTGRDIVLYGDLVDTVYGRVPHAAAGRVYGAGVYVQGFEDVVAGAKLIRNTNVDTASEQLAPGAIGLTNCTRGRLRADVIEDAHWYGVTVRDPNGGGNPGNPISKGTDAKPGGRVMIDVGVIRRARKASIDVHNLPIVEVRASIEEPRGQALLVRNTSTNVGRSLCERTILDRFDVSGGQAVNGSALRTSAIDVQAGTLEWRAGRIRGYKGSHGVSHSGSGAVVLGAVAIDGALLARPSLWKAGKDAGVTVATVTGTIKGTALTVTEVTEGYLRPGAIIRASGVTDGCRITAVLTGTGGIGTYRVSPAQTIGSTRMTARLPRESSRISPNAQIAAEPNLPELR